MLGVSGVLTASYKDFPICVYNRHKTIFLAIFKIKVIKFLNFDKALTPNFDEFL